MLSFFLPTVHALLLPPLRPLPDSPPGYSLLVVIQRYAFSGLLCTRIRSLRCIYIDMSAFVYFVQEGVPSSQRYTGVVWWHYPPTPPAHITRLPLHPPTEAPILGSRHNSYKFNINLFESQVVYSDQCFSAFSPPSSSIIIETSLSSPASGLLHDTFYPHSLCFSTT